MGSPIARADRAQGFTIGWLVSCCPGGWARDSWGDHGTPPSVDRILAVFRGWLVGFPLSGGCLP